MFLLILLIALFVLLRTFESHERVSNEISHPGCPPGLDTQTQFLV
jgi:hypothetical protein